jgi:flagellar basal body P-ring protein FlgI|tara:strand:+ start:704 stop:979 length:276 start_codon:yes stop_codon:yes gene_type:complete
MKRNTRSILQELQEYTKETRKELIIESRAKHAIAEATDIIQEINSNFDEEIAQDLEKRFINSIKSGDANKFLRAVKKLKDANDRQPKSVLD